MLTKKMRIGAIVMLIATTLGMTSCLKNNVDVSNQRPTFWMLLANVSTYPSSINLYENGTKKNKTALTGIINAPIGNYGGQYTYKITNGTTDSVLTQVGAQLDSLRYYSLFIYGSNPIKSAIVSTDLSNYSASAVNFRFYNMSENAGPVDVFLGSVKVASNVSYVGNSFDPSLQLITNLVNATTITVKKAGTDEVVATNNSISVGSMQTGAVYTGYLTGNATSTGNDKPSTNVIYAAY
ncbi:uncharacterized protein DUF4397 [Chitinophaga dinghuensis]|uniref:Uncharacterized protein DUF4397 n=1 Tax=Chitinophaga dinghuensis TaxID=1539050 RepID=A0A327WFK8_9BACT|nr:DUF4397 domain-containing protein [Chitinophaga dinghuensis]RAJ88156.1 uncharacterized protein DUF4397 [Chitinophaga dinghuensis]